MFDIGWMEMVVIGTVALIVVGPKDLPAMFRTAGNFMAKARGMARDFQRSMEQAAKEAGLDEVTKGMSSLNNPSLNSATSSAREYAKAMAGAATSPKPVATRVASPAVPVVAPDLVVIDPGAPLTEPVKAVVKRKPVMRAKVPKPAATKAGAE